MGLLRTILTLGLIPLGAFGAYRLAGSTGSRHAQVAALLIYIANPQPYNALANGRCGALVLYAAVPPAVGLLATAGALAPFAPSAGGDRKSDGWGKIVSVSVQLDGRRIINKKINLYTPR